MEQAKVGKFIAQCRKNKNMTQAELAEKLNITDRAMLQYIKVYYLQCTMEEQDI